MVTLNKGCDRIIIAIAPTHNDGPNHEQEMDEIKQYMDCRYILPCESIWRILSFPRSWKSFYFPFRKRTKCLLQWWRRTHWWCCYIWDKVLQNSCLRHLGWKQIRIKIIFWENYLWQCCCQILLTDKATCGCKQDNGY